MKIVDVISTKKLNVFEAVVCDIGGDIKINVPDIKISKPKITINVPDITINVPVEDYRGDIIRRSR